MSLAVTAYLYTWPMDERITIGSIDGHKDNNVGAWRTKDRMSTVEIRGRTGGTKLEGCVARGGRGHAATVFPLVSLTCTARSCSCALGIRNMT